MCSNIYRIESFPSLQKHFSPCQSGTMIPLFSGVGIKYVYAGTIYPGVTKGPYQHTIRNGKLCLLSGEMLLVHKQPNEIKFCEDYMVPLNACDLSRDDQYCLIGLGKEPALFVNMCDYAWQPGDNETIVPDFSSYNFAQWGIK